jgi:ribonucleoside-diphosphate reductase alpha chain
MQMVNEVGRHIIQGGSRRSAIWAGLAWDHPDVLRFIKLKDWSELHKMGKSQDFNFPAPMDMTNISVILTDSFFDAYSNPQHAQHELAHQVYWRSIENMLKTGEPGFSIDIGEHAGETLRNACTEITSRDSGDVCNLGSINLARISSLQEMKEVVSLATLFLVCGTLYSKLPLDIMYEVREKNRRLGLGLMGLHEWLLRHNKRYGPDEDLEQYLKVYEGASLYAKSWAGQLSVSCPVATRAIAPTGTISIVAETTSGCEPITYVALKRRYLSGKTWKAQYIVDPTAKRLIEEGIPEDAIEDSVTLSSDVERRIRFQHWLQKYVDHGISSTINLPPWGSELNNESRVRTFGETLLKYLPGLRGITTYPDGSRYGQPLVRVPYQEAIQSEGVEIEEGGNCKSGVCGV